jgi:hypothetical protein
MHGIVPKGSNAGLQYKDLGEADRWHRRAGLLPGVPLALPLGRGPDRARLALCGPHPEHPVSALKSDASPPARTWLT